MRPALVWDLPAYFRGPGKLAWSLPRRLDFIV